MANRFGDTETPPDKKTRPSGVNRFGDQEDVPEALALPGIHGVPQSAALPPELGGPAAPILPDQDMLSNYMRGAFTSDVMGGGVLGDISAGIVNMPRRGIEQATAGLARTTRGTGRDVAGGVSEFGRGVGTAIAPAALPLAMVAAPVATPVAIGTGALLGWGAEAGSEKLGLAPEYAALLGDTANLVGGAFGPKAIAGLLTRMKISPSGPVAEIVKFADDHGIPISAAVRTGLDKIRAWQARTAGSKAAQKSQAATQAGMTRAAEGITGPPPTTPAEAGAAPPTPPPEAGRPAPTPPAAAGAPPPTPPGVRGPTREAAAGATAQELRGTHAKYAAGESGAYRRLEEIEASNQQEVVTGTRRIESEMLDPNTQRPYVREEPITEKIGLPTKLQTAKARLEPFIAVIEQQLPPALREQSVGLQALRNIRDAPDTVSATVADGYLSAVKTLLRERGINPKSRRLLHLALDEVSPAVDEAVAKAGPEAVRVLAEGRQLTQAKYAVEGTMRSLKVPKADEFPLEPIKLFRKLTAPDDVNIGLLERVQKNAPQSMPAVAQATLEGLFDTALGREGDLNPAVARRAWNRMGPTTKRLLGMQPDHIRLVDDFFRQAEGHHLLSGMFDVALGREGKLDPLAALREWMKVPDAKKRDLFQLQDVAGLTDFFRQNAGHHTMGKIFDLALGREGTLDPQAALREWNKIPDATKHSFLKPPQIAETARFLHEATKHDVLQPLFDLALGRDGKLDPIAALRKWHAMDDTTRLMLGRRVSGVPSVDPQWVSEVGQFLQQAARQHMLSELFDMAKTDPAAALRKWTTYDAGTKRLVLQPQDIPSTGLFLRLAQLEGKTPRATAAAHGPNWMDYAASTIPEVAGLIFGHGKLGLAVTATYFAARTGTRGLSRLLWNPKTARILTDGIRVPTSRVPINAAAAASMRGVMTGEPERSEPQSATPPSTTPPSTTQRSEGFPPARGATLVTALAQAIKRGEGWSPGSTSVRNNNPGNLKPLPNQTLPGMIDRDRQGFARFESYDAGWNALLNQVQNDVSRGLNLNQFFGGKPGVYPGYAPAADRNRPLDYAATVGGWLGIDPRTPLSALR